MRQENLTKYSSLINTSYRLQQDCYIINIHLISSLEHFSHILIFKFKKLPIKYLHNKKYTD